MMVKLWASRPHECRWCGYKLWRARRGKTFSRTSCATVDHLLPRERGGVNVPSNVVLSCQRCNELRAAAGHCLGALACARTVLPYPTISSVTLWLRQRC